jgi:hypothetical protein
MGSEVLDVKPGGIIERIHDDNVITVEQDVAGIIADTQALAAESNRFFGFRKPEEFRHVASIPLAAIDIAYGKGIDLLNDKDAMRQWLNDPDNKVFRVDKGRV